MFNYEFILNYSKSCKKISNFTLDDENKIRKTLDNGIR